jgi:hypothetical protein
VSAVRLLWGAAVAFALAGIALRLAPAATPASDAPVIPAVETVTAASAPAGADSVVGTNMFGANRSAPIVRFTPRGMVSSPPPAAAPAPAPLRLYGITVTGDGALALIDGDPRTRGAEIYRVGDRVRKYRILAITDSTVALLADSGGKPLVLHLPPPRPAVRRPR